MEQLPTQQPSQEQLMIAYNRVLYQREKERQKYLRQAEYRKSQARKNYWDKKMERLTDEALNNNTTR